MRLTEKQIKELKNAHKKANNKRNIDKLRCLIYWGKNWSWKQIQEALFISYGTIKTYVDRYKEGGIEELLTQHYEGHNYKLAPNQESQLKNYLKTNRTYNIGQVLDYIEQSFGIEYTEKGVTGVLNRIGFVYVPPKHHIKHIDSYLQGLHTAFNHIKNIARVNEEDGIYFLYPYEIENYYISYGWIHKTDLSIDENNQHTSKPLNLYIAYDLIKNKVISMEEKRNNPNRSNINGITELIKMVIDKIQDKNKIVFLIYGTITDNKESLSFANEHHKTIELIYIPPYSKEVNTSSEIKIKK